MRKNILVKNVNINLLRRQRDALLDLLNDDEYDDDLVDAAQGIINMIDNMLDTAEGYTS